MSRIVLIGGGTGLPVLLQGLVQASDAPSTARAPRISLTAIVSVADSGGSTGRLREALRIPAVGDLRKCLAALAPRPGVLAETWQYRFAGGDVGGHALGNLVLAALCETTGGLTSAVRAAAELLGVRGTVLPVTESCVQLGARFTDGTCAAGEARITAAARRIENVWLDPTDATSAPGIVETLEAADVIVLSPGSLYTSVVANFLVRGVPEAIRASFATVVYVCNLMTQPGETDGFTASQHLRVLERYLPGRPVDVVVCNAQPVPGRLAESYLQTGSVPVRCDAGDMAGSATTLVTRDLLACSGGRVRHDPARVARVVLDIASGAPREPAFIGERVARTRGTAYGSSNNVLGD